MMQLRFLGRGAAFYPQEGNTAAYLREGDRLLLLDCGESVFSEIIQRKILEGVREIWIAVSHLHCDHCGSLGSLALYCASALGVRAHILLPEGDERYEREIRTLLTLNGVAEGQVLYTSEKDITGFRDFSSMRFCKTRHAPGMNCYSFAFETPEGGVFYTADTSTDEGLKAFMAAHPNFEHIYAETMDVEQSPVHLPLNRLAEVIEPELRPRVTVMHLNSERCGQAAAALGFRVAER